MREITASDFRTVNGYTIAHTIQVLEAKTQRRTTARVKQIRFDQGLDSELFSQRELKRVPRIGGTGN